MGRRGRSIAALFRRRPGRNKHQASRRATDVGPRPARRIAHLAPVEIPPLPKTCARKNLARGSVPQVEVSDFYTPPCLAAITGSNQRPTPGKGRRTGADEEKSMNESVSLLSISVPAVPVLSPPLSPSASSQADRPQTRMNAGLSALQPSLIPACPRVPGTLQTPRTAFLLPDSSLRCFLAWIDPAMVSPGDPSAVFCSAKRSPAPPPPAATQRKGALRPPCSCGNACSPMRPCP